MTSNDRKAKSVERTAKALWALDGARLYISASEMMPGAPGTLEMPVPSFLIEHERGLVLVDTGLSPCAVDDEDAIYGWLRPLAVPKMTAGQAVDAQLAVLGRTVDDITHVIVSHSHFDHTGGLYLFPKAIHVINDAEWAHVHRPLEGHERTIRQADFASVPADSWLRVSGDFDLFDDGAIVMLFLPGHTPGNTGVVVRLPTRTILLTMDTVHVRAAYDSETPLQYDVDPGQARDSIRRLKTIAATTNAEIWIGHDRDDWVRFDAPGQYR
jgi:glyoxylase-like metal-dependent hydrolase (beta-lactamase superfamily II)